MASLTIRNIDEELKRKLQARAARNGLSVEEDLRRVIANLVTEGPATDRSQSRMLPGRERRKAAGGAMDVTVSDIGLRLQRVMSHARAPNRPTDWKAARDELYDFLP